jgi:hypothetical protein
VPWAKCPLPSAYPELESTDGCVYRPPASASRSHECGEDFLSIVHNSSSVRMHISDMLLGRLLSLTVSVEQAAASMRDILATPRPVTLATIALIENLRRTAHKVAHRVHTLPSRSHWSSSRTCCSKRLAKSRACLARPRAVARTLRLCNRRRCSVVSVSRSSCAIVQHSAM